MYFGRSVKYGKLVLSHKILLQLSILYPKYLSHTSHLASCTWQLTSSTSYMYLTHRHRNSILWAAHHSCLLLPVVLQFKCVPMLAAASLHHPVTPLPQPTTTTADYCLLSSNASNQLVSIQQQLASIIQSLHYHSSADSSRAWVSESIVAAGKHQLINIAGWPKSRATCKHSQSSKPGA
jgi:hypothetical protein